MLRTVRCGTAVGLAIAICWSTGCQTTQPSSPISPLAESQPILAEPSPPTLASIPAVANPLHGTWVRTTDGVRTVAKLTDKRLAIELSFAGTKADPQVAVRLGADCAYGPDGSLFGVITDVDIGPGMTGDAKLTAADVTKLIDEPFSAKVRVEDGVLLLREVRCTSAFGPGTKQLLASSVLGHYRPMTDKPVPPVKSTSRWRSLRDRAESFVQGFPGLDSQTQIGGMTLPSPRYLQHHPQYYPPDAAFPLAREPVLPQTSASPNLPPRAGANRIHATVQQPAEPIRGETGG